MKDKQLDKTGNEILADFMGFKPYNDGRYGIMWPDPTKKDNPVCFDNKYDTSLEWLMKVWIKFKALIVELQLPDDTHLRYKERIGAAILDGDIAKAFEELVDGITWYNTNK